MSLSSLVREGEGGTREERREMGMERGNEEEEREEKEEMLAYR